MPTEYHYQLPQRSKLKPLTSLPYGIVWNTWEPDNGEEISYSTHIKLQTPVPLKLDMDSIWEYSGPSTINVTKIKIVNETDHGLSDGTSTYEVLVYHDGGEGSGNIYTDKAVPHYVSMWLQLPLEWSESDMQDDGKAHLEISLQKKGYLLPKTEYPL